jgi:putative membrane protein
MNMLPPSIKRNDRQARALIGIFSFVVFAVIVALGRLPKIEVDLGFDPHLFATANAIINSIVAVLLIAAYVSVRRGNYLRHKRLMFAAMYLSILFLVSYIAHHLLAGDTKFGGTGAVRYVYFILLATHIVLAAVILPFILFTAYRGLTGEYEKHKKLSKYTWPLWLYVALSGPLVYLMISPYYE